MSLLALIDKFEHGHRPTVPAALPIHMGRGTLAPNLFKLVEKNCPISRPPNISARDSMGQIQADLPHEWVNGVAKLKTMPCPVAYDPAAWRQAVNDAQGFIRSPWASQAARLAWKALNLFGVNPDAPYVRLDGMGLIPLLDGCQIVAITIDTARISCGGGVMQTFYCRHMAAGAVALWEMVHGR